MTERGGPERGGRCAAGRNEAGRSSGAWIAAIRAPSCGDPSRAEDGGGTDEHQWRGRVEVCSQREAQAASVGQPGAREDGRQDVVVTGGLTWPGTRLVSSAATPS